MLKRNNQVKTRLNDEEYFRLHRLAQMSGCTVSAFIRRCCLDEKRHIIIDREISCQIYNEMNAIGRNINQLARVANITKKISNEEILQILDWQQELCRVVDRGIGGVVTR
ncbi:plasmid mobilization protein [Christensenella minuta]|uniref:plasmid mobilization protein n=1 Tax=Christensenella minuta TaxID=626937 RepID=UPI00215819CE|nr:plasmid mobilization relaxosome protein MobC [Christensenella minuta]